MGNAPQPLFGAQIDESSPAGAQSASLFVGEATRGILAPWGGDAPPHKARPNAALSSGAAELLDLIALAEAGPAGYDAVQHGARIRPKGAPTALTLGEIFKWIKDTPGQPHAIGRYQFIPATLGRLVTIMEYGPEVRFTPTVQDQLAYLLLQEAGITEFRSGGLSRRAFMKNLARIWAGLPLPNGRSYYHGYAGNKATMSFARFESGMAQIFGAG
ncbi:MAG: hypothetical protein OXC60_02855 [Litoreibacter sp.]|nr:hypothetical protein [Litoreibacter sp.]MCY4333594.1 hypothetical protein [Litoreibacter sp.]